MKRLLGFESRFEFRSGTTQINENVTLPHLFGGFFSVRSPCIRQAGELDVWKRWPSLTFSRSWANSRESSSTSLTTAGEWVLMMT